MKQIKFPGTLSERQPPFFLAAEEWAAENIKGDCFFTWHTPPSVICGRHQDIPTEVNIPYCRNNNIGIYRRRSGGGCVFSDSGNMMLSYITSMDNRSVENVFALYSKTVADRLKAMGFDAQPSGRNDILICGQKVSGGAFYLLGERAIAHSTMLFDCDFRHILNAITPARAKLMSKGVKSVESRITTIRRHNHLITFDEFESALCSGIASKNIELTLTDIAAIEKIEQKYYAPQWLRIPDTYESCPNIFSATRHFDGVGSLTVSLSLDSGNRIKEIDISGDVFANAPLSAIGSMLKDKTVSAHNLDHALELASLHNIIPHLPKQEFIELVLEASSPGCKNQ